MLLYLYCRKDLLVLAKDSFNCTMYSIEMQNPKRKKRNLNQPRKPKSPRKKKRNPKVGHEVN